MSLDSKPVSAQELRNAVTGSKAYARLTALFDEGSMCEIDPLSVYEGKPAEAVAAFGQVNGISVCAFSQNNKIAGGAISTASAAKIIKVYDYALKTGCPVVGIYDSTGARLLQGNAMLASIGEMLMLSNNLSGVVPQISIIAGACVGTASLLASGADIVICAEDAVFGIDTAGGNKSGAEALKNGSAHITEKTDTDAVAKAREIISMLPQNNLSAAGSFEFAEPTAAIGDKPSEVIAATVDEGSFIELSKEFGRCVVTGLSTIAGETVGVVAYAPENEKAIICRDGACKAARFVRFCDAFSIPVVSFVNAGGFDSVREASMLAHAYAEATCPQVSVVTGAAYGAAYIALAGSASGSDLVYAWPSAVIAPLAPETAAAILYNDKLKGAKDQHAVRAEQVEQYKSTLASPYMAAEEGYLQNVIEPSETRSTVIAALTLLSGKRVKSNPKKHSNIQL